MLFYMEVWKPDWLRSLPLCWLQCLSQAHQGGWRLRPPVTQHHTPIYWMLLKPRRQLFSFSWSISPAWDTLSAQLPRNPSKSIHSLFSWQPLSLHKKPEGTPLARPVQILHLVTMSTAQQLHQPNKTLGTSDSSRIILLSWEGEGI